MSVVCCNGRQEKMTCPHTTIKPLKCLQSILGPSSNSHYVSLVCISDSHLHAIFEAAPKHGIVTQTVDCKATTSLCLYPSGKLISEIITRSKSIAVFKKASYFFLLAFLGHLHTMICFGCKLCFNCKLWVLYMVSA